VEHAWCRDVARDAAVRAAEDGRTGPLPTLGEAIASPFAEAAERSSTVSKTGEGQSGLRTERVTLEVCHDLDARLSDWIVDLVDESLGYDEFVRVVEGPSSDLDLEVLRRALATSEIRRLKAEAERDALRASFAEGPKLAPHANAVGGSNHAAQAASGGGEQPRGWLTAEEREAVLWAADAAYDKQHPDEDILRSLLARSSPPKVVLRDFPPDAICNLDSHYLSGWNQCMALAKKALAAAGVAVKEVPE